MSTATNLQAVETEIAAIQPQANELLDRFQTTTRAEGRVMKASTEWAIVERWKELLTQRAQLRDALEIETIVGE